MSIVITSCLHACLCVRVSFCSVQALHVCSVYGMADISWPVHQTELKASWRQSTRTMFVPVAESAASWLRRWPDETLKRAYGLCGQMTHFFAQFRLYLTFEALEPAWLTMQAQIRSAATLDQACWQPDPLRANACIDTSKCSWHVWPSLDQARPALLT